MDSTPQPQGAEKFRQLETELQVTVPAELNTENELADFWTTFRRNNGIAGNDDKMEKRMVAMQAKQTLAQIESQAELGHFFGAKSGDKMVATGKLTIRVDSQGEKHGYLSFLTVDKEFRGQGVAKQMTDVRSGFAKDRGCRHLDTDVFAENPVALVTKFNDGYLLTAIDISDDSKKFSLSKRIDGAEAKYDKKNGPLGELKEVGLAELEEIKDLLDQGYVGIDMKNIGSEENSEKNVDPKKWVLILEK